MEASQHDSTTSLDVASGTAVARFESGSFIQMQGDYLLGLLQWARRRVVRVELANKFTTLAAGVGSPTVADYGMFWRPDNIQDTNELKSTFWAARRINRMWLEIFNNPSNSTSLTYTFQVFKNGTQHSTHNTQWYTSHVKHHTCCANCHRSSASVLNVSMSRIA